MGSISLKRGKRPPLKFDPGLVLYIPLPDRGNVHIFLSVTFLYFSCLLSFMSFFILRNLAHTERKPPKLHISALEDLGYISISTVCWKMQSLTLQDRF